MLSARARFVRGLPFSVRMHRVHPGAVCLATIPPAQNPSPLQSRKHPFTCLLPQKSFDREFSPPRRAQLLPMISPISLNLFRTLRYPSLFLPYPADVFLPPSPSFPSAGRPLRILQHPPDVLLLLFFSPSTLHTLLVRQTLYRPPDVIPHVLPSAERYTVRLASFPTL